MNITFDRVLPYLLQDEGGYVNDPTDRGGATNKGVTQTTYNAYRKRKDLPVRDVRQIADSEVGEIYKRQYWDTVKADLLPNALRYTVFDMAVNAGPVRAVLILQAAAKIKEDGVLGQMTLGAAERVTLSEYSKAREQFYTGLVRQRPPQSKFLKGWLARVAKVHNRTLKLLA